MSQQLWLFRHGTAEKKSSSKNDATRALTKTGREEIERSAPHLRYLLPSSQSLFLWSSPLTRALQTAQTLSKALGAIEIEEKDFIAMGDLTSLTQELAALPADYTVIVVGHEPSLSEWTESLTGAALPFGKGACAAFNIKQDATADLLWFHQSESLQQLKTSDNTDAFKLKLLLQQHIKEAQSLHAAFLENPIDPETTHQFRVELRHLRSMLSFLKPLLSKLIYEEAQAPLRETFRQFAYLRELDVLIEEIEHIDKNEPELINDAAGIIEKIAAVREKEKSRLIHSSNQSKIRTILEDLWRWSESVDWFPLLVEKETFSQFAQKKISQKHANLKTQLKKLDTTNVDKVHQARIASKKYRYVLTDFSPLLEEDYEKAYNRSKSIQERLSIVPDLHHNMLALQTFINENEMSSLKEDLTAVYNYEQKRLEKQLTHLKNKPLKLK